MILTSCFLQRAVCILSVTLILSQPVALVVALATVFLILGLGLNGMVWASNIAVLCLGLPYVANLALRRFPAGFSLSNVLLLVAVLTATVLLLKGV